MEGLERLTMLLGKEAVERLAAAHIAVFGLGGVGGACAEALVRAGVGTLTVVDPDTVAVSNCNRQIFALPSTVGMPKTEAAAARLLAINKDLILHRIPVFFEDATVSQFDFAAYDYVIDCIDTVTSKLRLIECCRAAQTPILVCLGTGNKLDPSRLRLGDLYQTSVCPLARVMRYECRRRGIEHLTVVWSDEPPRKPQIAEEGENGRRSVPGSTSFVPPAAGLLLASAAVRALTGF